ncbi:MAG: DNA-binding domain-containing protein [Steroidobacteraceae bacterium]
MSALREFQHDFSHALLEPETATFVRFGAGIAVYQNTVMKGLVDALRANFPAVVRLTGDEWFDATAVRYAHKHLPDQPSLALYGAGYPHFLQQLAVMREFPYLPWVAHLDRCWTEVHFAMDAPALQAQQLAELTPDKLSELSLQLHPAVRFLRYPHSAVSIWQSNRTQADPAVEMEVADVVEAVLITRPHGAVQITPLSLAGYEFLSRIQSGATLGAIAAELLSQDNGVDVGSLLAMLLSAGAFVPWNEDADKMEA